MQNYIKKLEDLKSTKSFRFLKNINEKNGKYISVDGKKMLNLSSNDYLNVGSDKNLVLEFWDRYKNSPELLFSSASARLLTGNSICYKKLEQNFSSLYNKQSLLFSTGYQCNQGVVSTLFSKDDCIFSDKLNHASIVSGLKLTNAKHYRYKHLDYDSLEELLKKNRKNYKNAIIISESVFSMDGDIADIKKLVELKKKYNCLLMIDEAHAFGVFSDNLQGISAQEGLLEEIDIITLTLGKALGSFGAICLANNTIIDYLINFASSFIFTTAIPSINVLWSNFLLEEKFDLLKERKEKLNSLFQQVHKIYTSPSCSQIIPVVLGDSKKTLDYAQNLQKEGFYALAINPPTVPVGTSRLRISLTSEIELREIEELFKGL